ncbi:MAG TPA: formylglycine-generating enzyme family protein [Herpetosiphonaceae bacterium]
MSGAEQLQALLPEMITIPAGAFRMGTLDADRSALAKRYGGTRESYAEESPQHEVWVETFAIAQVPVTSALYAVFQAATDAHRPIVWGGALPDELRDHPVVDVSWHEAQAFCVWLGEQTGRRYRLPTEAEWEKAARGVDGRVFPWGDELDLQRCNVRESGLGITTPVGQYPAGASPYGVLEMAGSVWEWTQSLQASYPYHADDGRNGSKPRSERRTPRFLQRLLRTAPEHAPPPVETRRIIRGGCFANPEGFARCACRLRLQPERRTPFLGIRLALDG